MHTEDAQALTDFDCFVLFFFLNLKITQTSKVTGDVLCPNLIFSCLILLRDNVYAKSISVADTKLRITWQKPLVTLCLQWNGGNGELGQA